MRLGGFLIVLSLTGLATMHVQAQSTNGVLTARLEAATISGPFFVLTTSNVVQVSGTNTIAGSTRVRVNGSPADYSPAAGTWTNSQNLAAGYNRLEVDATDDVGNLLASTNIAVVVDLASVSVGGLLGTNTVWDNSGGIVRITNSVAVPSGGTLSIGPGTVLLLRAGASILATNAAIAANGTVDGVIHFLPADASAVWGGIVAVGTNGSVSLKHAEMAAGHVEILEGATGLLEDSELHDYLVSSPAIVHTLRPALLSMRRCHVARYYEVLSQLALNEIEDCLMENINGDGIDFDAARPGSYIRNCTIRHGDVTNVDGLDMGSFSDGTPSSGVTIQGCLIYDFVFDKGVSIGEAAQNMTVRNCVIHDVDSGVAVKDSSVAMIYDNTIADSNFGLRLYEKSAGLGGGHATAWNNVLWNDVNTVVFDSLSTISVSYSDLGGAGVYPGTNNLNLDPLFLNAASNDYRLATNSPCVGAGLGGGDIGALFPVGGIPHAPDSLTAIVVNGTNVNLSWVDRSDNESGFEIQRSADQTNWTEVVVLAADSTNWLDTLVQAGQTYQYRVRALNVPGDSEFSNESGATVPSLPIITGQPQSQTVVQGAAVTFQVEATGVPAPVDQWRAGYLHGDVPGATNDTLTLTNVQPSQAGDFRVLVSNPAGSVLSAIAVLTVNVPVAITQQPASRSVPPDGEVTLSVIAVGSPAPDFQWYFNDVALADATRATLVVTNFSSDAEGRYFVVASNSVGTVQSDTAFLLLDSPLRLSLASIDAQGLFHLRLIGPTNTDYLIEATSDFSGWSPLATSSVPAGILDFIDPTSTNFTHRFYRALPQ